MADNSDTTIWTLMNREVLKITRRRQHMWNHTTIIQHLTSHCTGLTVRPVISIKILTAIWWVLSSCSSIGNSSSFGEAYGFKLRCHGNFKFHTHCSIWLEIYNSSEILLGYRIVEETVRTARVFVEAEVKRTGGSERWNRIGRRGSEEEKEEGMMEHKLWTETELGWGTGL